MSASASALKARTRVTPQPWVSCVRGRTQHGSVLLKPHVQMVTVIMRQNLHEVAGSWSVSPPIGRWNGSGVHLASLCHDFGEEHHAYALSAPCAIYVQRANAAGGRTRAGRAQYLRAKHAWFPRRELGVVSGFLDTPRTPATSGRGHLAEERYQLAVGIRAYVSYQGLTMPRAAWSPRRIA